MKENIMIMKNNMIKKRKIEFQRFRENFKYSCRHRLDWGKKDESRKRKWDKILRAKQR